MIITALHKSSKIQFFLPKSLEFDIFLFNSYLDNDKLSVTYTVGIGEPNAFSSNSLLPNIRRFQHRELIQILQKHLP